MVRRWSYINNINTILPRHTTKISLAASEVVLNNIMFLRRTFPYLSASSRKNWMRRKHMNRTLFLSNVVINWAREYRFYKNYNRMLHYQFFFKNSYLAVNVVIQKSPYQDWNKYDTAAVGSAMPKRILKFFNNKYNFTRFVSLLWVPAMSWSYTSYLELYDEDKNSHIGAPYTPLYYIPFSEKSLLPLLETKIYKSTLKQLFILIHKLILIKNTEYYSIFIKLLFYKFFFVFKESSSNVKCFTQNLQIHLYLIS